MYYCPHCGEPIEEEAAFCPHCGSDEETGWSDDQYVSYLPPAEDLDLDAPPRRAPMAGARNVVVLLLVVVVAGFGFLLKFRLLGIVLLFVAGGGVLQAVLDRRREDAAS